MRSILFPLFVLLTVSVSQAQYNYAWHCSNRNCAMCNAANARYRATHSYPTVTYATPSQSLGVSSRVIPPKTVSQTVINKRKIEPPAVPEDPRYVNYSTPEVAVNEMLNIAAPKPDEVIYDLGCGDARILIAAVKKYGCRAVGVEINPKTVDLARKKVKEAGLSDRIRIVYDDVTQYAYLDEADIVTMYLYPDTIRGLIPRLRRLRQGTRVVSYLHPIPGLSETAQTCNIDGKDHQFYAWSVPIVAPIW